MTDEPDLPPPLTTEEMETWVGEVEDKAWFAQAESSGCRFLLGNLLAELQRMGLMNAGDFITKLRLSLPPDIDNVQTSLGIGNLLDDLQLFFHEPKGNPGAGNPGDVFH